MENLFDSTETAMPETVLIDAINYRLDLKPGEVDERWSRAWDAMNATLDETGYVSIKDVAERTGLELIDAQNFLWAMMTLGYVMQTRRLDRVERYGGTSNVYRYARPTPERVEFARNIDGRRWDQDPDYEEPIDDSVASMAAGEVAR